MNLFINTINLGTSNSVGSLGLTDISVISISLVKGWRESNLRAVWNESLLRSWPSESLNVFVSKVMNILIDAILLFASNSN